MQHSEEAKKDLLKDMLETGDRIVEGLKNDLKIKGGKLKVSDVVDGENHQYVNLVQEGGGVLGIALLGYTYVLESMGIRFLKLAGTSAGAINAALMGTVRPEKTTTMKTPIILYYLTQKNLFDFVDGDPMAKWLLKNVINYVAYIQCLLNSAVFTLINALWLIIFSSLLLWEGGSVLGLLTGSIIAYIIALLIFKPGLFSNGIIGTYLKSRFFLLTFFIVVLVLLVALGLTYIPVILCSYQIYLTITILGFLITYSIVLAFSPKHLKFIQIVVALILTTILTDVILSNFFNIQLSHYTRFILEVGGRGFTSRIPPYQHLSIAGISLFIFFFLLIGSITLYLLMRFTASKFGINPGNKFKEWIAELMKEGNVDTFVTLNSGKEVYIVNPRNNISTLRDLEEKLKLIPELRYEADEASTYKIIKDDDSNISLSNNILYDNSPVDSPLRKNPLFGIEKYNPDKDEPPLALITTEIVTKNKIVFPKMWRLFYYDKDHTSPADFVRASMSIPIFFEAFRIPNIPRHAERTKEWLQYLSYEGNEINEAVFVDGGSISNFPINVFNSNKDSAPRLPTFGARLHNGDSEDSRSTQSLAGIIGSIINSMRAHYDKDFLITHPQYEDSIAYIDVRGINWLNFNLPHKEQIDLFKRGAQAAANFLLEFDWEFFKVKQKALNMGILASEIRIARNVEDIKQLIEDFKKS